jgi:hypothetical protein
MKRELLRELVPIEAVADSSKCKEGQAMEGAMEKVQEPNNLQV